MFVLYTTKEIGAGSKSKQNMCVHNTGIDPLPVANMRMAPFLSCVYKLDLKKL